MSNSLDPDQARHFVGPDLGPNCLQRLSADDKLPLAGIELNTEQLLDTTWLKSSSFGSNFFPFGESLATTHVNVTHESDLRLVVETNFKH